MIRRFTSIVCLFVLAIATWAGPVSRQQAFEIAREYFDKAGHGLLLQAEPQSDLSLAYECLPKASRVQGEPQPLYYVINRAEHGGFVVVAGDDRVRPVVGYVEQGHFDMRHLHDNMRWWFQALEGTMWSVTRMKTENTCNLLSDENRQNAVEPLVTVHWGQRAPYNNRCPMDVYHEEDHRSLVGCVAVSMAQVLHRWQYPLHPTGQVDYTTTTHGINLSADLADFTFHWDRMLSDYSGEVGTAEQKDAVAELMYACGLAVNMDYCTFSSGAWLTGTTLRNNFGIDGTACDVKRIYYSRLEWDNLIKAELNAGRPVIYSGYTAKSGHSFICDGYNAEGLFHINRGWDGWMDGYFALSELNSAAEYAGAPSGDRDCYNFDQTALIGIQPKVGEGTAPTHTMYYHNLRIESSSSRDRVAVRVEKMGTDENGFEGIGVIAIFDENGDHVGFISGTERISLPPQYYYDNFNFVGALPDDLQDGYYFLYPVAQYDGEEFANLMRGRVGAPYVEYLILQVDGEQVALFDPAQVTADIHLVSVKSAEEECYAGVTNVFELTVRNDGAMYHGPLVLSRELDGENYIIYTNNYIFESGEERTLLVKVPAPDEAGTDRLKLWMSAGDDDDYYTNGCEYQYVDEFAYEVIQTKPGAPVLKLEELKLATPSVVRGEDLLMDMRVSNSGGFFDGWFLLYVFPEEGGKSVGYTYADLKLDGGREKNLRMRLSTANLQEGRYVLLPYAGGERVPSEYYYFNVLSSATGIGQVMEEPALKEQTIYDVSGIRMNGKLKELPQGVYVVDGKKVMVK